MQENQRNSCSKIWQGFQPRFPKLSIELTLNDAISSCTMEQFIWYMFPNIFVLVKDVSFIGSLKFLITNPASFAPYSISNWPDSSWLLSCPKWKSHIWKGSNFLLLLETRDILSLEILHRKLLSHLSEVIKIIWAGTWPQGKHFLERTVENP